MWRKKLFWIVTLVILVNCAFIKNGMVACAEEIEEEIVPVEINASTFPDEYFREYVFEILDKDQDGILSVQEIERVRGICLYDKDSLNLTGIKNFKNLESISLTNISMEKLDLGSNPKLRSISCSGGSIGKLDVSKNLALESLYFTSCPLKELCLDNNKNLKRLKCVECGLKQLDVSKNELLGELYCNDNELQSLDLSNNTVLKHVECHNNLIETISFGKKNGIEKLWCNDNKLENIDISMLSMLKVLWCENNELKSLDTSQNTLLERLSFSNNKDIKFDISKNSMLTDLSCAGCGIENLNVYIEDNKRLKSLNCSDNNIEKLYLSSFEELGRLYCKNNKLEKLVVGQENLTVLECQNNKLRNLEISSCDKLKVLNCSHNELENKNLTLPKNVHMVDCSYNKLEYLYVRNTIELGDLDCSYNNLKGLYIYPTTTLCLLNCSNNLLTYLDTTGATKMEVLNCSNNNIGRLYTAPDTNAIKCDNNKLEYLEVHAGIKTLHCYNNNLTSLNVKKSHLLESLNCSNNNLSNLELQENKSMRILRCDNNKLTSLNLESNSSLLGLYCSNNSLTNLNLENNTKLSILECENNEYAVSQESQLDLSTLPGFQLEKASLWKNATIVKPILFVVDSGFPVTYTYNVGRNLKANFKISFDKVPSQIYDFAYSPNVYNQKLAEDSALYSMLAYDEYRVTSGGQYFTQAKGRQNCPIMLLAQLKRDGFYNWSHYNYRDGNPHNCSYTFATRNVKYNGEQKTQILVCIRGTDSVEWEGNMDLTGTDYNGNYASTHYSFEKASNSIEASLYNYIATIRKKGVDTNQCIIWVTGHSRGGAVANLLSAKLTDSGSSSIGHVFGYTYATANATTKYKDKSYNNIFNHCFVDDFVPSVPFEKWGYGNYGITYVANADYAYQAGKQSTREVYRQFKDGMDRYIGLGSDRKESRGADFNYEETSKMLVHVTNTWEGVREYYEKRTIWFGNDNFAVSLYTFFHDGIAKLAQGKNSYIKDSIKYIVKYPELFKVFKFFVVGNSFKHNINDTHQSYTYYLATKLGLFNSPNSTSLKANNTEWELSKSEQPQEVTEKEQGNIRNAASLSENSIDYSAVSANSVSRNTVSENDVPKNEKTHGESIPCGRAGINEEGEKEILTCEEEKERLVQFATLDENKAKLGWNLSDNSTWSGIEFDEDGYVISIAIPYKELTGVLDLSGFNKLRQINCEGNGLTSLVLDDCISIVQAECYYNTLQTLRIKHCENLQYLDCDGNELEELDLSTCKNLTELACNNNQLTSLDVSLQSQLDLLFCQENRLTNIALPEINSLSRINCEYNYLKDLSQFEALAQKEAFWVLYREQKVPEDAVYAASDLENLKGLANTEENLKKLGWNLKAPATWDGITWRYVGGTYYVEDIQLANRNLTGNPQLSNMEQLQSITLAENSISGLEINQCAKLECVNCMENKIEELSLANCNSLWKILGYYNCLKNENYTESCEWKG